MTHPNTLTGTARPQRRPLPAPPPWRRLFVRAGLVASLATLAACRSKAPFEFDELDQAPAQEELTEFTLGRFVIPIPLADDRSGNEIHRTNRVQFEFELHALVRSDDQARVADAWQRHQGKIRDRVIRACRLASFDDLQELKAHLMDAVQDQLGQREVRQLLITEVKTEQL